MLLFVYGEHNEGVRSREEQLREHFSTKHDPQKLNTVVIEIESKTTGAEAALQELATPPFLAKHKLIVVRGALTNWTKKESLSFADKVAGKASDVFMLFVDNIKEDKAKKHHILKTATASEQSLHEYHYPALRGGDLQMWAAAKAKDLDLQIDGRALQKLIELCADDIGRVGLELLRLKAYFLQDPVDASKLDLLVPQDFEQDVFAFTDLLASRDLGLIGSFLTHQKMAGLSEGYLFAMVARQVRLWIHIMANERSDSPASAKELGLHPFVYNKTRTQTKAFSAGDLVRLHDTLFKLDLGMKTGAYKDTQALQLLLDAIVR